MKDKEITIYDNYFNLERENDARAYLFDDYAEEEGWKTPEDIPDERVWDEIEFQDRMQWDDMKAELETLF